MFGKPNAVERLRSSSQNVVNIFHKTVKQLQVINEEIVKEVEQRRAEKARIEVEIGALELQSNSNLSVIKKIENLLS